MKIRPAGRPWPARRPARRRSRARRARARCARRAPPPARRRPRSAPGARRSGAKWNSRKGHHSVPFGKGQGDHEGRVLCRQRAVGLQQRPRCGEDFEGTLPTRLIGENHSAKSDSSLLPLKGKQPADFSAGCSSLNRRFVRRTLFSIRPEKWRSFRAERPYAARFPPASCPRRESGAPHCQDVRPPR